METMYALVLRENFDNMSIFALNLQRKKISGGINNKNA
jgi:hypothetical protein